MKYIIATHKSLKGKRYAWHYSVNGVEAGTNIEDVARLAPGPSKRQIAIACRHAKESANTAETILAQTLLGWSVYYAPK